MFLNRPGLGAGSDTPGSRSSSFTPAISKNRRIAKPAPLALKSDSISDCIATATSRCSAGNIVVTGGSNASSRFTFKG